MCWPYFEVRLFLLPGHALHIGMCVLSAERILMGILYTLVGVLSFDCACILFIFVLDVLYY
jgi:hypothetical protein